MSETLDNEAGAPRRTHRVYSLELKQQIVLETLQPGSSVSAVARKHGINDNIVFEWRRLHRLGRLGLPASTIPPSQCSELLPVHVIDSPAQLPAGRALPPEPADGVHGVKPSGCESRSRLANAVCAFVACRWNVPSSSCASACDDRPAGGHTHLDCRRCDRHALQLPGAGRKGPVGP
ncbi:transposase [Paraburkholderia sp. RL17-373-BIF-A]